MDVSQLAALVQVAELGSISRAAAESGYSQSAVSRQIQALEREFGSPLLERTARGVRLTGAGRALLPHAREIVRSLELAYADVSGSPTTPTRLRIGCVPSATGALIAPALARLGVTHPELVIEVRQAPSPVLLRGVAEQDLDAAVVMAFSKAAFQRKSLREELLFTDQMMVVVPLGHHLAGSADPISMAVLREEVWVEEVGRAERILLTAAAAVGFTPRIRRAPDLAAKVAFVAAGIGVAMVPGLAAAALGRQVTALTITDAPRRGVRWIARRQEPAEAVSAVREALQPDGVWPDRQVTGHPAGAPSANSV